MAKVILTSSARRKYDEMMDYAYANFGEETEKDLQIAFNKLVLQLSSFSQSASKERLLSGFTEQYRSIVFRKLWRIVYVYDSVSEKVLIVDIWDNRSNPDVLWKNFKE